MNNTIKIHKNRKTHELFIKELYEKFGDVYNVLEQYQGSEVKILIEHKCSDGNYHRWMAMPQQLLCRDKAPCPKCNGKLTGLDGFKQKVYKLFKDEYIVIGDKYKNHTTDIKIRHNTEDCQHEFLITPKNLFRSPTCPNCSTKISKGEDSIQDFLVNSKIEYVRQKTFPKCRYKRTLQFDFYLPDYDICIEFQGQQHYEPVDFGGRGIDWANNQFKLNRKKDNIKRKFCKKNNIILIEIPYWESDNIENILINTLNNHGIMKSDIKIMDI